MVSKNKSPAEDNATAVSDTVVFINNKSSSWVKKLFITLVIIIVIFAGLGFAFWQYFLHWADSPLTVSEEGYEWQLKPGQTLAHVSRQLSADGVLQHPEFLRVYARLENANKIHAGDYRLDATDTPKTLVKKLVNGDVVVYQVTLLEGWTFKQFLSALANEAAVSSSAVGSFNKDVLASMGVEGHPEGWFFPDTYTFARGTRDIDILRQATARMQSVLQREWKNRAANLPYKTSYEALIMASIIERETGHKGERNDVAGVFVRRLKMGMRLQTDPTVIYGMGEKYTGKITRKDLETPTEYNTYVIAGLPPTPISMPSEASIKAALHPADGNAIYFVAKGDGTSHFSATLDEHNQAVRKYQLNRRADYRAAPPSISSSGSSSVKSEAISSSSISSVSGKTP
jgi:UPF0755 protein